MLDLRDDEILDALGGRLVARLVIECATALRRYSSSENRSRFGLNNSDWSIIALVGGSGEIGFKELRALIALDPGQLSRGLSRLENHGLVLRENLKTFPREQRLRLTDRGQELFGRMRGDALERNRRLLEAVSTEDLRTLARVLPIITARARAELKDDPAENAASTPAAQRAPKRGDGRASQIRRATIGNKT